MDERVDYIKFIQILWIKVHMFMDADGMVNILKYLTVCVQESAHFSFKCAVFHFKEYDV